jgi:hypothetical protein
MNIKYGVGNCVPPDIHHVKIYFIQQSLSEMSAIKFFDEYEGKGWTTTSRKAVKNWKTEASEYIWKMLERDAELRREYFRTSH